ncbi:hypothetical protein B0A48_09599 [Cryoendolithus antarcticus]|uniref:Uncharacterized protein n=1 Tax=Cryoendolithus antarcticus TaxID=1507870 RepID=A0A1V8SZT9_9PEZI|nr:hypothetical protein B0A48_09599 [Cryoendolithus antarcticus]
MFSHIETIDLSNDDDMSTPTVKHFARKGIDGATAGKVTLTSRGSKDRSSLAVLRARYAAPTPLTPVMKTVSTKRKAHDDDNEASRKSAKTATVESAGGFKLPTSIDQNRKIFPDSNLSLSNKWTSKHTVQHTKSALPKKLNAARGETHRKLTLNTDSRIKSQLTSPPSSAIKTTAVESPLFCTPPPPSNPLRPSTPPPSSSAQRDYEQAQAELQNAPKKVPRKYKRSSFAEACRRARNDTDDEEDLLEAKIEDQDGSTGNQQSATTLASSDLWSTGSTGIYGILGPKRDSQETPPAPTKKSRKASTQDFGPPLPAPTQQRTAQQAQTEHTAQLQQIVQDLLANLTHISQVPAITAAQQQVFNHQLAAEQQVFDHQYHDMGSFNAELHRRLLEVERDNNRFKNGTFPNTQFENRVATVEREQVDVKKQFDEQCRRFVGGTNGGFMERDVKVANLEKELDRVIGEFEEWKRMRKKEE